MSIHPASPLVGKQIDIEMGKKDSLVKEGERKGKVEQEGGEKEAQSSLRVT
jgi:hypothetical protein